MNGRSLAYLQVAHLTLLVVVSSAFTLIYQLYGAADSVVRRLMISIAVLAAATTAVSVVLTLRSGDEAAARKSLWNAYRRLLANKYFAAVSDAVLLLIATVLIWCLVAYRPVAFLLTMPADIFVADAPGEHELVASASPNVLISVRLHVGHRLLVFRDQNTGVLVSRSIDVLPWWKGLASDTVVISRSPSYEQLR